MNFKWEKRLLYEVCSKIGSGQTPRGGKESYKGGQFALVRSQNIYNESFTKDGLVYINDSQAEQLSNVEIFSKDVLINITGDSVARSCMVPEEILPARVNQHVAILRADDVFLDSGFLRYFIISPRVQKLLLSLSSGGATRKALTKSMLESFEIAYPDLVEQRKIAKILESIDKRIEVNKKISETLETISKTLFKSWFIDFDPVNARADGRSNGLPREISNLFPNSFIDSELGEIPKGWEIGELGDLVFPCGKSIKSSNDIANQPYVPIDCITSQSMTLNEYKPGREAKSSLFTFKKGDILFGAMRPYFHKVCLAPFDGITRSTCIVLRENDNSFHTFALLTMSNKSTIEYATQNSTGSTIPYIRWNSILEKMKVKIPPKHIAQSFEKIISPMVEKFSTSILFQENLRNMRDAILPKLISGQLSISDGEKILEEVGI